MKIHERIVGPYGILKVTNPERQAVHQFQYNSLQFLSEPIFLSDKHLATYSPYARAGTRTGSSWKPVVTAAT
jgi:hypothetical protein